jgi:predicted molibdopterin-dependent oxidoreductase YjgC
VKGRLQKFAKAVEAPGDARPEIEFLQELVEAVAGPIGAATIEGLFNRMSADIPAFGGVQWAAVGDTGVTLSL